MAHKMNGWREVKRVKKLTNSCEQENERRTILKMVLAAHVPLYEHVLLSLCGCQSYIHICYNFLSVWRAAALLYGNEIMMTTLPKQKSNKKRRQNESDILTRGESASQVHKYG